MVTFTIMVGYTLQRPPVIDQHMSRVIVTADRTNDATLTAALITWSRIRGHDGMVTSTRLVGTDD